MDIVNGELKAVWRKYLLSALGSAVITSVYSTVDLIVVGQYEGPAGSAAMAVVGPVWSIIMSFGLMFGIGGSVLHSIARGSGDEKGEGCFTATLLLGLLVSALLTAAFLIWEEPILRLFGADDELLGRAMAYCKWLIPCLGLFLIGQILIFFLRNDGDPVRATAAVACCGVLNIFLDIFFVFTLDMGIEGAALATVLCQALSVVVLGTHFLSKKNTLRLRRPARLPALALRIVKTGFSPWIVDLSVGISSIFFNNQIMRLAGSDELAVYGTASNLSLLVLSLLYGVGGALQPIVSVNEGAGQPDRVRKVLRLALTSAAAIGAAACAAAELFPAVLVRVYMDATPAVLAIAPGILRVWALAYLFMGVNIVSSYFFQSVLRTGESLTVSLLRGIVLCGTLVFALPAVFGFPAVWWTMPLTELLTAGTSLWLLRRYIRV